MHALSTDIVPEEIALALDRAPAGWLTRLRWFASVGSTNDLAARFAEHGAEEWTVVAADEQTSGRGRLGRSWTSRPGAGLYLSVVLRPPAHAVPLLTLAAGVAVAEAIEASTGLSVDLKWPNDVMAGARKLGGILAEAGSGFVILGIGLNVQPAAYPPEIADRATSLEAELGRRVDRGVVLAAVLDALLRTYRDLCEGRDILEAWRRRARRLLQRQVTFEAGSGRESGLAFDVDQSGALLVRTAAGISRVIAGEVTWI